MILFLYNQQCICIYNYTYNTKYWSCVLQGAPAAVASAAPSTHARRTAIILRCLQPRWLFVVYLQSGSLPCRLVEIAVHKDFATDRYRTFRFSISACLSIRDVFSFLDITAKFADFFAKTLQISVFSVEISQFGKSRWMPPLMKRGRLASASEPAIQLELRGRADTAGSDLPLRPKQRGKEDKDKSKDVPSQPASSSSRQKIPQPARLRCCLRSAQ